MAKEEIKSVKNNNQINPKSTHLPEQGSRLPKIPKTFGQKAADILTTFAGSWTFILSLLGLLAVWMALNLFAWINHWDPYPFILLNLFLSSLAAIQAPVILMSQNREEQRDRTRSQYDYAVNRKAEREIEEIREQLNRIESKMK